MRMSVPFIAFLLLVVVAFGALLSVIVRALTKHELEYPVATGVVFLSYAAAEIVGATLAGALPVVAQFAVVAVAQILTLAAMVTALAKVPFVKSLGVAAAYAVALQAIALLLGLLTR
ncbi:MAG: hypothetical protein C0513_03760 [Isosphaera sp.]|nr:hypothetical protein [Isosphaera sp.]